MTNIALKLVAGGKEVRDQFINQTDVLDKVKALITLPINEYVETKKVAEYFEVNDVNLRAILARNKEEFKSDGVVTMMGAELKYFKGQLIELHGITLKARSMITLFTKKAVLRMGMMLESSPVAKEIRNYLLNNVEDNSITGQKDSRKSNWNTEWDNAIVKSMQSKLDNGQKLTHALKEVSSELDIPYNKLYSRWYTGSSKLSPLKLEMNQKQKPIKVKSVTETANANINKVIEESNSKLIRQFEKMMIKQQEIFTNALGKVWRKLEEVKDQQTVITDDINMIKFDIAKINQSVDQTNNEGIQNLEKRNKSLRNKLKDVEAEKDQLLKFIGRNSVMSEALINDEKTGVTFKMDRKGNVELV